MGSSGRQGYLAAAEIVDTSHRDNECVVTISAEIPAINAFTLHRVGDGLSESEAS